MAAPSWCHLPAGSPSGCKQYLSPAAVPSPPTSSFSCLWCLRQVCVFSSKMKSARSQSVFAGSSSSSHTQFLFLFSNLMPSSLSACGPADWRPNTRQKKLQPYRDCLTNYSSQDCVRSIFITYQYLNNQEYIYIYSGSASLVKPLTYLHNNSFIFPYVH